MIRRIIGMKDKLHIIIIFSIILFLVITGIIVRILLQPESFGLHGNYRWDANREIMSKEIINQNTKTCGQCHNDRFGQCPVTATSAFSIWIPHCKQQPPPARHEGVP